MEAQFASLGLDFTFVDAVEGRTLDYQQLLDNQDLSLHLGGRHGSILLSEVGCYMSHKSVWWLILRTKQNYALVCEDDIVFRHPWIDLANLVEKLPERCDLLYVGHPNDHSVENPGRVPIVECGAYRACESRPYGGTYCYLISERGARKCLSRSRPIRYAVDGYLISLINEGFLCAWALQPSAAIHTGVDSSIEF